MIGYRTGFGYDIHALVQAPDGHLPVGGIIIATGIKPLAHSDGDALIHSLIDAILGALGAGDIGEYFPDSNPQYHNISSVTLLGDINKILTIRHASIINIDITILLQNIKILPYKESIRANLASILNISQEQINIKAKTKEGLDATGKGEAIEVYSALILNISNRKK